MVVSLATEQEDAQCSSDQTIHRDHKGKGSGYHRLDKQSTVASAQIGRTYVFKNHTRSPGDSACGSGKRMLLLFG